MVGTEAYPYASEGGFASVLFSLSNALNDKGNDVRLLIPKYGSINEEKYQLELIYEGLKVPTDDPNTPFLICNIKKAKRPFGATIYFIENQEYYEKRANVYGYSDDPTRWALLSRGVLEFIKAGIFVPDVLHTNDWHTGIVSNYLKTVYSLDPVLSKVATVYTIHNLKYQGNFDHHNVAELDTDDGRSVIASFFSERLNKQNFMRRGILHADIVNTVSKKYAKEVLTPEYGEKLDKLLLELKSKFFGVINGLDYKEFNPETDPLIEKNYNISSLEDRVLNKLALQKEFDLQEDPEVPTFGFVGRLDYQKGVDLIVDVLFEVFKEFDLNYVSVGGGDPSLVKKLEGLKQAYPSKVGIYTYFNTTLPRLVFSGVDSIIYPSRFEPCGVVQLEAMRYGAAPIVREVGGLADTVVNFDSDALTGSGFVFKEFNSYALYGQIVRAIELYKQKNIWKRLQVNAMKCDFSWGFSANEYIKLYRLAIQHAQIPKKP